MEGDCWYKSLVTDVSEDMIEVAKPWQLGNLEIITGERGNKL